MGSNTVNPGLNALQLTNYQSIHLQKAMLHLCARTLSIDYQKVSYSRTAEYRINIARCSRGKHRTLSSIVQLEELVSEIQIDYRIRVVEENRSIKMVKTVVCTLLRRKIEAQKLKHISNY